MAAETELKLRINPKDAPRIGHLPWLSGNRAKTVQLGNLYYDTPDRELAGKGIALRHRVIGRRWLITVKSREASAGGLAVRGEWEYPCEPGVLDFSGVEKTSLQTRLKKLRPKLQPVFSTDFKRRFWLYQPHPDLAVEVAVDLGKIVCGQSSQPLCEVELELKHGTPLALYELALDIALRIPVVPENRSKAERGYRLAIGATETPVSATSSPLQASMTPITAFRQLASSCIDHFLANIEGVRLSGEPEYIHQVRIAIRRLRALLKLFSPLLPHDFVVTHNTAWRHLAGFLGDARDHDVLIDETLSDVSREFAPQLAGHDRIEKFIAHAKTARARAHETARMAFLEKEPGQLALRFMADLARLIEPKFDGNLKDFARHQLARNDRRVRRDCRNMDSIGIEALHRLRIKFKRLRYSVEFFAPFFKTEASKGYLVQLKAIQDILGRINDLHIAHAIESAAPRAIRSELIESWLIARQQAAIAKLPDTAGQFLSRNAPWK